MNPQKITQAVVDYLAGCDFDFGAPFFSAYENKAFPSAGESRIVISANTSAPDSARMRQAARNAEVEITLSVPRSAENFAEIVAAFGEGMEEAFAREGSRGKFNAAAAEIYAGEMKLDRIETPSVSSDEELTLVAVVAFVYEEIFLNNK